MLKTEEDFVRDGSPMKSIDQFDKALVVKDSLKTNELLENESQK